MIIIKTLSDIQQLKENDSLEDCIISYLEKRFNTLSKESCNGKVTDDFSLEKYGCLVFLQNEDDCRNLSMIGLHNEYKCTYPEYVDQIPLKSKNGVIELYNACILINNEFAVTVFSIKNTLDIETERFLRYECS